MCVGRLARMLRLAKKQSTLQKMAASHPIDSHPIKCPSSPDEANSNGENRVPDIEETSQGGATQLLPQNQSTPSAKTSHFNSCGNITLHSHVELHKLHPNGTAAHVI